MEHTLDRVKQVLDNGKTGIKYKDDTGIAYIRCNQLKNERMADDDVRAQPELPKGNEAVIVLQITGAEYPEGFIDENNGLPATVRVLFICILPGTCALDILDIVQSISQDFDAAVIGHGTPTLPGIDIVNLAEDYIENVIEIDIVLNSLPLYQKAA